MDDESIVFEGKCPKCENPISEEEMLRNKKCFKCGVLFDVEGPEVAPSVEDGIVYDDREEMNESPPPPVDRKTEYGSDAVDTVREVLLGQSLIKEEEFSTYYSWLWDKGGNRLGNRFMVLFKQNQIKAQFFNGVKPSLNNTNVRTIWQRTNKVYEYRSRNPEDFHCVMDLLLSDIVKLGEK